MNQIQEISCRCYRCYARVRPVEHILKVDNEEKTQLIICQECFDKNPQYYYTFSVATEEEAASIREFVDKLLDILYKDLGITIL